MKIFHRDTESLWNLELLCLYKMIFWIMKEYFEENEFIKKLPKMGFQLNVWIR